MKKRLLQQAKSNIEKKPLEIESTEPSDPLEVVELDLDFIEDKSSDDDNDKPDQKTAELDAEDDEDTTLEDLKEKKSKHLLEELTATQNVHETVRDLIFKDLSFDEEDEFDLTTGKKMDGLQLGKEKRKELYDL